MNISVLNSDIAPSTIDLACVVDVSIVIPCHNEFEVISALHSRLCATMDSMNISWECILIDDGSTDVTVPQN